MGKFLRMEAVYDPFHYPPAREFADALNISMKYIAADTVGLLTIIFCAIFYFITI